MYVDEHPEQAVSFAAFQRVRVRHLEGDKCVVGDRTFLFFNRLIQFSEPLRYTGQAEVPTALAKRFLPEVNNRTNRGELVRFNSIYDGAYQAIRLSSCCEYLLVSTDGETILVDDSSFRVLFEEVLTV
jgi:hypothetical protein